MQGIVCLALLEIVPVYENKNRLAYQLMHCEGSKHLNTSQFPVMRCEPIHHLFPNFCTKITIRSAYFRNAGKSLFRAVARKTK